MATKPVVLSCIPLSFLQTMKSLLPASELNWSSHGVSFSIEEGIATIEISDESKFHLSCAKDVMEQFILDGIDAINESQNEKPSWLVDPKQSSYYQENVLR